MSNHTKTDQNKMGMTALALMIFTSVYGFANIALSFLFCDTLFPLISSFILYSVLFNHCRDGTSF